MSHFIWLYWNNQFFYKTAGCPLLTCYDSFWHAVAFNEQLCLFNKCGFLLTQYCGHKRTKGVFYWSRGGGNYWSAESFTNPLVTITVPRCYLPIHSVIYQSAGAIYWSVEKKKWSKQTQKKKSQTKFVLHVYLSTLTQFFTKKKFHNRFRSIYLSLHWTNANVD